MGLSWMQYAVIEHNLSAASKLYHNITFKALGRLLSVTEARVSTFHHARAPAAPHWSLRTLGSHPHARWSPKVVVWECRLMLSSRPLLRSCVLVSPPPPCPS